MMKKIRFFNTFNLVVPLLNNLLPSLNNEHIDARAVVSKQGYRKVEKDDSSQYFEHVWSPPYLRKKKPLNHLFYFLFAPFKILFTKSDLNVFFTQPPFFYLLGTWLSRMKKTPYAVHIMDIHPDIMGKLGILNNDGFLYKRLSKMVVNSLNQASFVVAIGRCMKTYLIEKGVNPEKIRVVINVPAIKPIDRIQNDGKLSNPFLLEHQLENKFIVLYAGNIGRPHEFETILNVAKKLETKFPDIHFVFVGKGARRIEIENFVSSSQPSNISLMNSLPLDAFTQALSGADCHFISLREGFQGILVPSKYYSSLAIGKPVIFEGPIDSELGLSISENGLGEVVPHLDQDKLYQVIISYFENREKQKIASENSLKYFKKECTSSKIIEAYHKLLKTEN